MGIMTRSFILLLVIFGLSTSFRIVNGRTPHCESTKIEEVHGVNADLQTADFSANKNNAVGATNVSLSLKLSKLQKGFADSRYLTWLSLEGNKLNDIPFGTFKKVPNLSYLSMKDNRITNLNLIRFSGLKKLNTLVLDGNNVVSPAVAADENEYDSVTRNFQEETTYTVEYTNDYYSTPPPERITHTMDINLSADLPALTHLYLRNNKIERIFFAGANSLPMLTHLFISDNTLGYASEIIELQNNAPSLTHIYLERNNITSFNVTQMENIVSLFMDGNDIRSICSQNCNSSAQLSLKGANKLQCLSVSSNSLIDIENDAFDFTENLLHLNLSHNRIATIRGGTFEKLAHLEYLSLEHNLLSSIADESFLIGLSRLSHLSLSYNRIPKVSQGTFKRSSSLRKLSLDHNVIANIEAGAFTDLPVLEELSLTNNLLSTIPPNCWPQNGALYQLDVSDNRFTDTDHLSLDGASQLSDLYIKGNPLKRLRMNSLLSISNNFSIILDY